MKPDLGDVAVRARGLSIHLLSRSALRRLARSSGSGVLASALQAVGYWPAMRAGRDARSVSDTIDRAIEHETIRRLGVLARWLGERSALFACIFEDEHRRALRIRLRHIVAAERLDAPGAGTDFVLPRLLREDLLRARSLGDAVRALESRRHAYAAPLAEAIRARGESLPAIEAALDRAFARRAGRAAARYGGRLLQWVREGIDLENAWDASLQGGGDFVEGGAQLTREHHAAIAREARERPRRRMLAEVFARGPLAGVFDDPRLPIAVLETRATQARIRAELREARLDPLGPAPILLWVMRLRAERADLRRINLGIAQGLSAESLIGQLMGAVR